MKTARFLLRKGLALSLSKGFTLVELLIVIALIGVLAVAVLAAINPLEQLNRARDTGMESDASQLLAAIDRYYATQEEFPWVSVNNAFTNDSDLTLTNAQVEEIGICAGNCATNGILLEQYELKSEFRNRKFITATAQTDLLYLAKQDGASSSVYACWVPTSKAKRANANMSVTNIWDNSCDGANVTYANLDSSCFFCIPR